MNTKLPNIDITPAQRKTILTLLERYVPNTEVWVYGSRVTWRSTPKSDLDMVVFSSPKQGPNVSSLIEEIEESNLPFYIDLFVWDEVPEQFRKQIEAKKVILQERKKTKKPSLGNNEHWKESTWGEEIELKYGKAIRGYRNGIGPYQVFGSNGPVGWHSEYIANGPGIILGRKGAYRGVKFSKNPFFVIDTAYYVSPKEELDMRWLYYAIIFHKLGEIDDGSPIPSTTRAAVYVRDLSIPPLPEQKAIAHILGSLDDKIELNRRMNETLEAMAQALFKSWFVDFDPVIDNALAAGNEIPEALKARAATRQALGDARKQLPEEIRQLFPSSFVFDEEMGWVPEGWEIKPLDSLITLIGGGTPKTSVTEYWNGQIPWFSVVDAPNQSDVFVIDTEKHVTQLGVDKSSTKILPIGTTIISARGTVGKCAMVGTPMAMNQSCYGIRGKQNISDSFVYFTIFLRVSELQRRGHGSVFNTITRDTFKTIQTPFGKAELTVEFESIIKPNLERVLENNIQSATLSRLRDTLLPKLLSGQIRIPDAEKLIQDAL